MVDEPIRFLQTKLDLSAIGSEFEIREVREKTRAFLAKLIALSASFSVLAAGCYGVITGRYIVVVWVWNLAAPIIGCLVGYYFASSNDLRPDVQRPILQQNHFEGDGLSEVAANEQSLTSITPTSRYTTGPIRERGLNPFIWVVLTVLISAAVTIVIGTLAPTQSEPLLLGFPFLAFLATGLIGFLWLDQSIRRKSLLRTALAGFDETNALKRRSASLKEQLERRHETRTD